MLKSIERDLSSWEYTSARVCVRAYVCLFTCAINSGLLLSCSNTSAPTFVHSLWIGGCSPITISFSILNVRSP